MEDKILQKLEHHDQKFDAILGKEKRIFLVGWMKRIEDRFTHFEKQAEEQKEEIIKIKALLKLA